MPTLGTRYLSTVLGAAEAPCVSLYFQVGEDPAGSADRLRDLLRTAEDALAAGYSGRDLSGLIGQLRALPDDAATGAAPAGLVVLASPSRFDVFRLPRVVPELVEVGETFHVKPLLRHVQSADPFHVLAVSRDRVALFDGNRYELHPLTVPGVPLSRAEGLHPQRAEGEQFHTEASGPGLRGDRETEGTGKQKPVMAPHVEQFYRAVDRAVTDLVSNPDGRPVILAGTPENLAEFRGLSKNRFVMAEEVRGDWTHWTLNEIREKAWPAFEKHYLGRLATVREDFGTAAARGKGTADPADAGRAAAAGRIGTLLVDADRTVPGALDFATGEILPGRPGDVLDDLAEMVLKTGGTVTVVPSDRMPTATGLAAIYRY